MPKKNTPTTVFYIDSKKRNTDEDTKIVALNPVIIIKSTSDPSLINKVYTE